MKLFSGFGFGHRFMDAGSLDPVSNRSSEFQSDTRHTAALLLFLGTYVTHVLPPSNLDQSGRLYVFQEDLIVSDY